jgi:hypothetical protein
MDLMNHIELEGRSILVVEDEPLIALEKPLIAWATEAHAPPLH